MKKAGDKIRAFFTWLRSPSVTETLFVAVILILIGVVVVAVT